MKIHLVSDLHLEFQSDGGQGLVSRLPGADVLVVAGDLTTSDKLKGALSMLSKRYPYVVFVPGNHDWYGGTLQNMRINRDYVDMHMGNVQWLRRGGAVEVNGQRFVGDTLWFPINQDVLLKKKCINDFSQIRDIMSWLPQHFEKTKKWLRETVRPGDIVITHHLPAKQSIAKRFKGSGINCFFLGDVEDVIRETKPAIWCHGHTHDQFDYRIGETRVVCNPLGYPRETGADAGKPFYI